MENKYYYVIYGFTVKSDIKILGAMPCEETEKEDISLEIGEIPVFLQEGKKKGYKTWTNGYVNAWFLTPAAAEFYVEKGKKVVVSPLENPNWDLISSMFLSAAMCLIMLQRHEIVFHGSTIQFQNKAVILSGASGAGKSTVTMELLKKPYGFLADDTVRVHEVNGIFLAEPSYPQQKLCKDMALRLDFDLQKLRYIDEERDKYAVINTKQYYEKAIPLNLIILLRVDAKAKNVCSKLLTGQEYIESCVDALYLEHVYREIVGTPMEIVMQILKMSSQISVYEIVRPKEGDTVQEVCKEIERLMMLKKEL